MKVLVTGANGFLGNNIIRELNRRNIPVRALVRKTADIRILRDTDVELFYGDPSEKEVALNAVRGCEIVIHTAADTSHNHKTTDAYKTPNITITENLLDAGITQCIERFIYVSTANAFGFGSLEKPGNENLPPAYPFTLSGYATSKIRAQQKVIDAATGRRIRALVVNPTFMIGPYDHKPSSGRIITMMYNRRIIPVPPGGKNFIHVKDVATGICNAIALGKTGECYILANENLSYAEFYSRMARVAGKQYHLLKLTHKMMSIAGFAGNLGTVLGFRPELTLTNSRMLSVNNYYSGEKAVKELGLPQSPVEQAISEALDWFRKNGNLK